MRARCLAKFDERDLGALKAKACEPSNRGPLELAITFRTVNDPAGRFIAVDSG